MEETKENKLDLKQFMKSEINRGVAYKSNRKLSLEELDRIPGAITQARFGKWYHDDMEN